MALPSPHLGKQILPLLHPLSESPTRLVHLPSPHLGKQILPLLHPLSESPTRLVHLPPRNLLHLDILRGPSPSLIWTTRPDLVVVAIAVQAVRLCHECRLHRRRRRRVGPLGDFGRIERRKGRAASWVPAFGPRREISHQ
jgi:hypothetical protein